MDIAKVDIFEKVPYPVLAKAVIRFLRHAGFFRWFIKDFPKIAYPLCMLLDKEIKFDFRAEYQKACQNLKRGFTEVSILIALNWALPFKIMCAASYVVVGEILGQHKDKLFSFIYYVSKTLYVPRSRI